MLIKLLHRKLAILKPSKQESKLSRARSLVRSSGIVGGTRSSVGLDYLASCLCRHLDENETV